MTIEIDNSSGFCFGVTRAIGKAEEILASSPLPLYCLGDIVHNSMECDRLSRMGLKTIDHQQYDQLHNATVLLRAHGEPPQTYQKAQENEIEIIDATCPVVLHLQERIKKEFSPLGVLEGGYVIIRTAWLYSEFGKNFCKTMLQLTATKPQLNVVFDQCGTPTYALDLARAIKVILTKPVQGIYHFSNEGVCSWYDFAQMIARISGHKDCDIQPCRSSEFPSAVKRPAYSVLDKRSIRETFDVEVPYWVDSLEKCIANIKKQQTNGNN